jgi:hypothetical protein
LHCCAAAVEGRHCVGFGIASDCVVVVSRAISRKRMFNDDDHQQHNKKPDERFGETIGAGQKNNNNNSNMPDQVMHPAILRLKSFLNQP